MENMNENINEIFDNLLRGDYVGFKHMVEDELSHRGNELVESIKPVVASNMFGTDDEEE